VIDDSADLNSFTEKFLPFLRKRGLIARLEREVIDAAWQSEAAIDPGVVFARHSRHITRFHESDELITPSIEEDMTDLSPLFDRDGVADDRLKAKYVFVKLTRFVEIESRKPDVRKSSV